MGAVVVNEAKWMQLMARLERAKKLIAKVGVLQDTPHEEELGKGVHGPRQAEEISMVELAAIHEFGSPAAHIPERSFIRSTFADNPGMEKICARLAKAIVTKDMDPYDAVALLGVWGEAQVKKTIRRGLEPDLAPSTVDAKGSSKPLVDTGQLMNAITSAVEGTTAVSSAGVPKASE